MFSHPVSIISALRQGSNIALLSFGLGVAVAPAFAGTGTNTDDSGPGSLRVCSRSLRRITEFSQHQANRGEVHERQGIAGAILKVLSQATTPIKPSDRAFHNPPFR